MPAGGPTRRAASGCHGEDGTGGGHGPNIVDVRRPRATSKNEVRDLILKGIPDGGMPAFQISDAEADAIAVLRDDVEDARGRRRGGSRGRAGRPRGGRALLHRQRELRRLPHGARDAAACWVPIFPTSAAIAGRSRSNRSCAIPKLRLPPRRAAADVADAAAAYLSRGDRAHAQRPDPFAASPRTKARSTCNCWASMASSTCSRRTRWRKWSARKP